MQQQLWLDHVRQYPFKSSDDAKKEVLVSSLGDEVGADGELLKKVTSQIRR